MDSASSLRTVDFWHDQVHDDDVGPQLNAFPDGFLSVAGFSDDLYAALVFEQGFQSDAPYSVVSREPDRLVIRTSTEKRGAPFFVFRKK